MSKMTQPNFWTLILDETELILELVKDICNELDVRSLCHKILQNVGILTDADRWDTHNEGVTKRRGMLIVPVMN